MSSSTIFIEPTTTDSSAVLWIILYSSIAIVVFLILIVGAIAFCRSRNTKIVSQSIDTTGGPGTNASKEDEVKQMEVESTRQHLKKEKAEIEEIVKLQESLKTRRKHKKAKNII